MRSMNKLAAVAGFITLFASPAFAATVTGTVKGPDGAPFEGAFVVAVNAKTKISVSVLSDKRGRYRVENLPAGDYQVRVRAVGFTTDTHSGVSLTTDQNISFDFPLKPGTVRWSDLNLYQGKTLMPDGKGKDTLSTNCYICHGFQTRMAAVRRDEDGWRDRVNYMRDAMGFQLGQRFNDEKADEVVSYLNTVFGSDSKVTRNPTELPGYKDTVRPFADESMNIVYVEYDVSGPLGCPGAPRRTRTAISGSPTTGEEMKSQDSIPTPRNSPGSICLLQRPPGFTRSFWVLTASCISQSSRWTGWPSSILSRGK